MKNTFTLIKATNKKTKEITILIQKESAYYNKNFFFFDDQETVREYTKEEFEEVFSPKEYKLETINKDLVKLLSDLF